MVIMNIIIENFLINMKIAICLSGLSRFIEQGYNQISEKILHKYNVDFFIHTWWDESICNTIDDRGYKFEENTLEKISKIYKPKIFHNETRKEFNILQDVDYETLNPTSPYSMFYSIMRCNELKKSYEINNNFKYDVVIRCRFDILINKLDIKFEEIEKGVIYTDTVGNGFPNDQFALGDSASMDYYSSLYKRIYIYHQQGFKNFVGERLLRYHLENSEFNNIFSNNIKNNIIKK